ncbi:MAG: hypothetical protein JRD87_09995 [Deltaproteobacteria bacterium]|jgi:hypothetical protein|nr:hypothetical protein [Deltaproteobacteria bacterium]MBW2238611.1 hypothetical protein [Deltaproteobacteria bacterium]MBW2571949.1 hypothetical protein [Deltaproteobacteria bacterium]MBW2670197.1 hypothetical protein [Deltaproteobacteria bacterium]NOQ20723.1 hypothetical protein [Desulfobacterales bacterium]
MNDIFDDLDDDGDFFSDDSDDQIPIEDAVVLGGTMRVGHMRREWGKRNGGNSRKRWMLIGTIGIVKMTFNSTN